LFLLSTSLSGCSYASQFAATIDESGGVRVEWCFTSEPVIVVRPSGAVVRHRASAADRPVDSVNPLAPGDDWAITGQIDPAADDTFDVWSDYEFDHRTDPKVTTADTADTNGYTPRAPAPALSFTIDDLEVGSYLHDGHLISRDDWYSLCHPDDDGILGAGVLLLLAFGGLLCIGVVVTPIVWGIRWGLRGP
jgi:hypothetical protein